MIMAAIYQRMVKRTKSKAALEKGLRWLEASLSKPIMTYDLMDNLGD
jgi:hypothetical protein